MNLKKFISGISALTIAASAFAGMAVTASAAETVLFNHDGSETTAPIELGSIGGTAGGGTTYGAAGDNFQIKVDNSKNTSNTAKLFVFNHTSNSLGNYQVANITKSSETDNFYVLGTASSRKGAFAQPINSTPITNFGEMSLMFAMPTYKPNKSIRGLYQSYVQFGDIAQVTIERQANDSSTNRTLTVSPLSNGGIITSDSDLSFTVSADAWVSADLLFNVSAESGQNSAKLTLKYGTDEDRIYYFSNVGSTSLTTMTMVGYGAGGGGAEERWGAIAFDDVVIKALGEAPDTAAPYADTTYTIRYVDGNGDSIGVADIVTDTKEASTITATSAQMADITYNDTKYIYRSGNDSRAAVADASGNIITLVYTPAQSKNVVLNAQYGTAGSENVDTTTMLEHTTYYKYYPKYKKYDGKWYFIGQGYFDSDEHYGTKAYITDDVTLTIPYTEVSNIAYFTEVEDQYDSSDARSDYAKRWSGGKAVTNGDVTTDELDPGVYDVLFAGRFGANSGTAYYSISGGSSTVDNVQISTTSKNYVVPQKAQLQLTTTSNNFQADYVVITKVRDLATYSITSETTGVSVAKTATEYNKVTVSPAEGYTLSAVNVVPTDTESETTVTVTDNGDGTFSFTMPSEAVTVTATATEVVSGPSVSIAGFDSQQITYKGLPYTAAKLLVNVVGSVSGIRVYYGEAYRDATDMTAITNGTIVLGAIVEDGVTVNESTFSVDVAPAE